MAKPLLEVVGASYKIFLRKVKVFCSTWAFLFAALEAPPVSLPETRQACCHHSYVRTVPGWLRWLRTGSESSVSTLGPAGTISKEEWWQTRGGFVLFMFLPGKSQLTQAHKTNFSFLGGDFLAQPVHWIYVACNFPDGHWCANMEKTEFDYCILTTLLHKYVMKEKVM